MSSMVAFSYPKINLALDIFGVAPSGHHYISTVFHQLSAPADEIIIKSAPHGFLEVKCDNPRVPIGETNTVYKAADLLRKHVADKNCGAKIFIKKKIPIASGLGGGSSNAVAALKGLAKLWGFNCHCDARRGAPKQSGLFRFLRNGRHNSACPLRKIANQIGMDCNFFFDGGTALGEHFGERITPLPAPPASLFFEIIETGVPISTQWAYENIDLKKCSMQQGKTEKLIQALRTGDANGIIENLHNDFEQFIFSAHPELKKKKREAEIVIARSGRVGRVLLCGSGGVLIQIFRI